MESKLGKLSSAYVWLFALCAVVVGAGSAYITSGLGAKVSSGVYFAIFLVSGFAATALTEAKALVGVGAMLLASTISAAVYYFVAMQAMVDATSALGAADAGGAFGAAIGAFVAVVTFFVSAAGGVSGSVAGSRVRAHANG